MTICRKCGKEIPEGEELCEDCKNEESNSGENYLDELMQNIETDDIGEPAASERLLAMQKEKEERAAEEASEMSEEEPLDFEIPESELVEEEPLPDFEPATEEEPLPELEDEPEPEEVPLPEPEDEPLPEPEDDPEPETTEVESEEELPVFEAMEADEVSESETSEETPEDINELLDLLSKNYDDEDEDSASEEYEFEDDADFDDLNNVSSQPASAGEASLFSEDDTGSIFADGADEIAVDDIFQDALSAVDYSEKEETNEDDVMSLDAFDGAEESADEKASDEEGLGVASVPVTEPSLIASKKVKKEGKVSFWKRIFGNVITEQTAAEEEQEREQEKATEEAKAAEKEEKKKQAAETKEEKAAAKAAEKEKKAAEKAERATAKAAEKEEKKRLKLELEANEVVGKINPVGAAIVMVFFGLICISVILGTQMLSYSSAVKNAESSFESGDYRNAYESIAGVDVSDSSQELAEKVRICMQVQKELDSYTNYYKMRMYLEALDSLMKGIRSYDLNRQKADDYGIINEYNALENKVADVLNSEFGVSETQARSINSTEDLVEYTAKLEDIIRRWDAKNREDER